MNLNKCERCGCFFASKNAVCPNCQAKDAQDINCLKRFLSEQESTVSVEGLAYGSGVSLKNVNRYLQDKKLHATFSDLGLSFDEPIIDNIDLEMLR